MEWISVKERLPEFDKRVLFFNEVKPEWQENNYGTVIGYLISIQESSSGVILDVLTDDHQNIDPTHWMPLPNPPKE